MYMCLVPLLQQEVGGECPAACGVAMFLDKVLNILGTFIGNESTKNVGNPSTTGDTGTPFLLRCGVAGREGGSADFPGLGDVHGTEVRDLEVGKDVVFADLGHRSTVRQCLFDIRLRPPGRLVEGSRGPLVASDGAILINVYESPGKCIGN